MKRIVQILDTFTYGDAIGNHVMAISDALNEKGIETCAYAKVVDDRVSKYATSIDKYENQPYDVILYHLSSGTDLNYKVTEYNNKLVVNYHNITPPKYMHEYSALLEDLSIKGYEGTRFMLDKVDMVISDSDYNSTDLVEMGYKCPMNTVPIIINFDQYDDAPNSKVIEKYSDGITNIVFIGRIVPNKKQEDIILDFYYYSKYFNPNSRLILVGSYNNMEHYYLKLKKYAKKLGLSNIVFTGHVSFSEMLAYYNVADVFVCESEHEGFCVPLVEAMYFKTPIIAYDSSAVSDTLGPAGILVKEKNPKLVASLINEVLNDKLLYEKIIYEQIKRIDYFRSSEHIEKLVKLLLDN